MRYVVPHEFEREGENAPVSVKMRVSNVFKKVRLEVIADGEVIAKKSKPIVTPGEMETINLTASQVEIIRKAKAVSVGLSGGEK